MKKILKFGTFLVMLCVLQMLPMTVQATSILDAVTETQESYAEDTNYILQRSSHLSYGNVKLTEMSSNSIGIYGLTQCLHQCDNVYVSLYLERKVNGGYSTYKSWDYSTTNSTSFSKSLVVSVPTGYYYRVRGYHAAKCNGEVKESTTTLTSGVYVG